MSNIYEQFEAAFANVSAFYITDADDTRVGRICIKFPRDSTSRLYAYVHVYGSRMVRGSATGYGYNKRTAAVGDAAGNLRSNEDDAVTPVHLAMWKAALMKDSGADWTRELEAAGYRVHQVI